MARRPLPGPEPALVERASDQAAGLRRLFARTPATVVVLLGTGDELAMARLVARCVETAGCAGCRVAPLRWLPPRGSPEEIEARRTASDVVLVNAAGAAPVALLESARLDARAWLVTAVDDLAITEAYAFVKRRAVMLAGRELGVLALGGRERDAVQWRVANLASLARDQLGLDLRCVGWLPEAALQSSAAAGRGAQHRQAERAWRGVLRELAGRGPAPSPAAGFVPPASLGSLNVGIRRDPSRLP